MRVEDTRRVAVLDRLRDKTIKQGKAAEILGISTRQVRRLLVRYKRSGVAGIIHKLRGLPSNHQTDSRILDSALSIIQERYSDFNVSHAHEKLVELHNFPYSRETLRTAMIMCGLKKRRPRPKLITHNIRERRACEGELVQVDGSPHDWFEGRDSYCDLIVFIDDATGKLKYLQFVPHESTLAYMAGLKSYIIHEGKPLALYSDRHGIFKVSVGKGGVRNATDEVGFTQFGRACNQLGIELILANSPQAKGRVERVNETLQDRLVKEMRLRGIRTMAEGNSYLPTFIAQFNKRFSVPATTPSRANTPLLAHENLEEILVEKEARTISPNLTISYKNQIIQVVPNRGSGRTLLHKRIEVWHDTNNTMTLHNQKEILQYKILLTTQAPKVTDSKLLNTVVDKLIPQSTPRPTPRPVQPLPIDYEEPWLLFTPKPNKQVFASTS